MVVGEGVVSMGDGVGAGVVLILGTVHGVADDEPLLRDALICGFLSNLSRTLTNWLRDLKVLPLTVYESMMAWYLVGSNPMLVAAQRAWHSLMCSFLALAAHSACSIVS
jgi:DNA polymerase III psi subunit